MFIRDKYTIKAEIKKGKKLNPHLIVSIYQSNEKGDSVKIGDYQRDHHDLFNTFFPFKQNNKEFALISRQYSKISVIELPSCKVIAEENWSPSIKETFYPIDFYVLDKNPEIGFVAGCKYNDETNCKIECLDLSDIVSGKITRDGRFGKINLPENIKLEQAIQHELYSKKDIIIDIAVNLTFNQEGNLISKDNIVELLKNNGYIVFEKKRIIKE